MIWILYWLVLVSLSTTAIYLIIDHLSHSELDDYNRLQKQQMDQAELAYLKTKKTQSRIKSKPDL